MIFNEDWKKIEIDNIGDIITGKTPSTKDEGNFGEKYLFITPRDMNSNKYVFNTERKLSEKGFNSINNNYIEGESVCVSCIGSDMGEVVMTTKKCVTNQQINSITRIKDKYNPEFLYYYLKPLKEYFHNIAGGTTMPILNKTDFSNIKISIPKLSKQKQITNMLSTLDKKIENNNKMNKNLEEMAQAIYKNWFVDFEPFKDEEFVDSELGMIPVNMELKSLKEFFPVKTGKKNANIADDNGQYAFFTCSQEMKRANEYSFDDTAILLAGNGDFNVKWYRGKFEAYQRTYVLIPDERKLFSFLYYSIDHFLDKLILGRRGSVISYLTKGMIEDLKIPVLKDQGLFNDIIERLNIINCFIENNKDENQSLKELRDSLLPKLMSGEIRVPLDEDAKEVN